MTTSTVLDGLDVDSLLSGYPWVVVVDDGLSFAEVFGPFENEVEGFEWAVKEGFSQFYCVPIYPKED